MLNDNPAEALMLGAKAGCINIIPGHAVTCQVARDTGCYPVPCGQRVLESLSMMHYTITMASKNSNPTIQTLDKNAQDITKWNFERGRMARLTDIELIRRIYKCEQLDETKLVPGSSG